MITRVAERVAGTRQTPFDGQVIDFNAWTRITMAEAILKYCPERIAEADLKDRSAVERLLKTLHADFDPRAPLGILVGVLFETVAERHLVQPTIVYEHPVELSPLAKTKKDDPSIVERFELFIGGMELANAYSELNDPVDQRVRFEQQLEAQNRGDEEAHHMDLDYIRALSYGMPPTAGEGIGVDRLTMILTDSRSIRDVILFPHMRPE
jgi:lysyl-tRNA synthetase class 2